MIDEINELDMADIDLDIIDEDVDDIKVVEKSTKKEQPKSEVIDNGEKLPVLYVLEMDDRKSSQNRTSYNVSLEYLKARDINIEKVAEEFNIDYAFVWNDVTGKSDLTFRNPSQRVKFINAVREKIYNTLTHSIIEVTMVQDPYCSTKKRYMRVYGDRHSASGRILNYV